MSKILFIDNGIEFDSKMAKHKPVGGAESAFISLVEALAKSKNEVVVYNNCVNIGKINGVFWKRLGEEINDETFDVLVVNRGDKFLDFKKECNRRFFWIHNPANYLLKWRYLKKIFLHPCKIIFSSNYHSSTYPKWGPNKEKLTIPYGIDDFIFDIKKKKRNTKNRNAIFTSNPMRGLNWLLDRWEYEIFPSAKGAELDLYTGFSTYGEFGIKNRHSMTPVLKRAQRLKLKGVNLYKPINRKSLMKKIFNSRAFLYQGSKEETFCMSLAEAQVIGIPAVVSDLGCMKERVIDKKTGFVCNSNRDFSDAAIKLLTDDKLWQKMHKNMLKKFNNYQSWTEIARMWEKEI